MLPVFCKPRIKKPSYIFEHYRSGASLFNKANGFGKQVSFIIFTKLFSRNGKGRARNPSGQQIDASLWEPLELTDIRTYHIPFWAILF